jgi:hypothetical protein
MSLEIASSPTTRIVAPSPVQLPSAKLFMAGAPPGSKK